MITLQKLFMVILTWTFLPVAMKNVDGSKEPYPTECDHKTCLLLCCHFDEVLIDGTCVQNNDTSATVPRIITSEDYNTNEEIVPGQNFHPFINDPCIFESMISQVSNNIDVHPNGSISTIDFGGKSLSNFEHYCLFRELRSDKYSIKVCYLWMDNLYWDTFCLLTSILIIFVVFIVYTIVPELKNLHGMMFRSYLGSYVGVYAFAVGLLFTAESKTHAKLFSFFIFAMEYWAVSCVFWLNVMSFDIWWTFRSLQSVDSFKQKRKKKKFIWYAIYAWVIPAVLISSYAAAMCYMPFFNDVINRQNFRKFGRTGAKGAIFLCNSFFYLSTALLIRRHKRDTVDLANDVHKHHDVDKQTVNLHVKLYLIMGGHMIPWIIWDFWPTPVTTSILVALEMVQCCLIFFIFVFKEQVKQSLREQFGKSFRRQRFIASVISNASVTTVGVSRSISQ